MKPAYAGGSKSAAIECRDVHARRRGLTGTLMRLPKLRLGPLGKVLRALRRDDAMVSVALSVNHDDGRRTRHLGARVRLPSVPRAGELVRAGGVGSYLLVDRVLWDEGGVMVILDAVSEHEHALADLRSRGWQVRSEWSSTTPSIPARASEHDTRRRIALLR
jgi:hypothetical protein